VNATVKLSSPVTHEFWEIPILFEDEHVVALDKPAGLLTSPDRLTPQRPSLLALLRAAIEAGKPWARERGLTYLANTQRMDVEASGVLLLAKNKPALIALADQFSSEKPARKYVVLVQGVPGDEPLVVDAKIARHPANAGLMMIDTRQGKKTKTEFAVLEKFSRWALVRATPCQERPQQIPLHLSFAGFPLVGDEIHGGKKLWLSRIKRVYRLKPGHEERPLISSPVVHADELTCLHPVTQQPLSIKCEWPKELRVALKYLRQYAKGGPGEARPWESGSEESGPGE
jgi:RluA family pseudouridine synthase